MLGRRSVRLSARRGGGARRRSRPCPNAPDRPRAMSAGVVRSMPARVMKCVEARQSRRTEPDRATMPRSTPPAPSPTVLAFAADRASSWRTRSARRAAPSRWRAAAAGTAGRRAWRCRRASWSTGHRDGGAPCPSTSRAHRAARRRTAFRGVPGRRMSAWTISPSSRSRARLAASRFDPVRGDVDRRDPGAGAGQLRRLAARRGAEIGDVQAGDIAEQPRRKRGRGILHPPGALGKAGQVGNRARQPRHPHRAGRQDDAAQAPRPSARDRP